MDHHVFYEKKISKSRSFDKQNSEIHQYIERLTKLLPHLWKDLITTKTRL
jgi:hypothetical protein